MEDQEFINQLAEKLSKLGTVRPLGFHYLHPYGTVPADSIICNGATYSRALYKDFFDYITTQGWVKTEAEWQEVADRDNGFCPFYSEGDGSTNFRTPKFAPYQQIAMDVAHATTYHEAGLPNISGSFNARGIELDSDRFKGTGCFYLDMDFPFTDSNSGHKAYSTKGGVGFSASRSSSVYGASDTVQPESHEWMLCVVVAGQATNLASVDMADVLTTVAQVQADISQVQNDVDAIPRPNAYVTQTWRSGTKWYRVWSDGWVEQGGHGTGGTCTFNKPFSNTNYTFNVQPSSGYTSHPDWIAAYEHRPGRTTAKTSISYYESGDQGWDWRASGY